MKKTLFIDFDGTLCHDRFWRSFREPERSRIQKFIFEENKDAVADWMRGRLSSEDMARKASAALGLPYEEIWRVFVDDCKTMNIETEALALIRSLRPRWHVVLMTDNMDCFSRFTVPALCLGEHFDRIRNSSDEGSLKLDGEGEAFEAIAREFGTEIGASVLIDDSPRTCAAFAAKGGTALLVRDGRTLAGYVRSL